MLVRHTIAGAALLSVLLAPGPLRAEVPFTAKKAQFGLGPNYGFYIGDDEEIPNTHGPGVHVVAGYTLDPSVYLGGEFNYFLGGTERQVYSGVDTEITWTMMQFGAEVGYDLALGLDWVLRPKIGVGYASVDIEIFAADVFGSSDFRDTESYGGLVVPLGLEALYSLSELWFLAAKFRYGYTSIIVDVYDQNFQKVGETTKRANGIVLGAGVGGRF